MDNSLGTGFMTVFAVSGSVVFLAVQVHKRILSNFMKKMEFEIKHSKGRVKEEPKKKVRFSDDVVVVKSTSNHKTHEEKHTASIYNNNEEILANLPQNWQAMYRGILQYRNLRGYN